MPGLYAFIKGREIVAQDAPFDAIIQAAMRKADTPNGYKLRVAFPEEWADLQVRYNAPGGLLEGES